MWHWFYKFSKGKPGHENMYESPFNLRSQLMLRFPPSQPKFQPRVNVVSESKFNIKMMLIQRWKWNKIRRRIFSFAQRWYNISARRSNNVETTLHKVETMLHNVGITLHNVGTTLIQRCFNLALTLVKPTLNPIGLVMIVDCVTVIHVKYMNSFYSPIWESIFLRFLILVKVRFL